MPFISCIVFLGCNSPYKKLRQVSGDPTCVQAFKPAFRSVLYKTHVDVYGRQLSGLLLIKTMPDSSTRLVFTSETGITFFDFEFSPSGDFKVHYIMKQMNKTAVTRTLRKDFEMILWDKTSPQGAKILTDGVYRYATFPQEEGAYYYITDSSCSRLVRIERGSNAKVVAETTLGSYQEGVPDTISIIHKNARLTIILKRLEK